MFATWAQACNRPLKNNFGTHIVDVFLFLTNCVIYCLVIFKHFCLSWQIFSLSNLHYGVWILHEAQETF